MREQVERNIYYRAISPSKTFLFEYFVTFAAELDIRGRWVRREIQGGEVGRKVDNTSRKRNAGRVARTHPGRSDSRNETERWFDLLYQ